MRITFRLTALVILSGSPVVAASGQTSESSAYQWDYVTASQPCGIGTGTLAGSSGAACNAPMTGGVGYAASASNNSARYVFADSRIDQTGPNYSMAGYAVAWSNQNSLLFVNGTSGPSDQLVFHFTVNQTSAFGGTTGGSIQNYWQAYLSATTGDGYGYGTDTPTGSFSYGIGYTPTSSGADITVAFSTFTGTMNYLVQPYVYSYMYGDQLQDAYARSTLEMRLDGIDLLNANGDVIRNAYFFDDGNAAIDIVPEPASMILLATGLLGVFGVARRRSRAHSRTTPATA